MFLPSTLGFLTAFGPIITDFYLPSVPEMQTYFRTSPSAMSASLTAGMIGLALGQLLIGPLSDRFGRRRPLVGSMILFALSSVGCLFAPNVAVFNTMRVLQGLGGSGGVVLSKSIATDLFSGDRLTAFMAMLGAVTGLAPVVAPVLGGFVAAFTSWKGVFALLLVLGLLLAACTLRLNETLTTPRRAHGGLLPSYAMLGKVFRTRRFAFAALAVMAVHFAFFAYIASSPFIFQRLYGLSPFCFSVCFGVNALMIVAGAFLATRIRTRRTALRLSGVGFLAGAVSSPLVSLGDVMVTSSAILLAGAVATLGLIRVLVRELEAERRP